MKFEQKDLSSEIVIKASRSSGKGGQNVNKVATKIELSFNIENSLVLTEEEKTTILANIKKKISKEGNIKIISQTERSQLQNKEIALTKFYKLINDCFVEVKKRKATKPGKKVKEKRLQDKKIQAEKKETRKKIFRME